jgi:hypothetical protein
VVAGELNVQNDEFRRERGTLRVPSGDAAMVTVAQAIKSQAQD